MDLQNSANHLLALPIIPALKRQLLRSRGREGVLFKIFKQLRSFHLGGGYSCHGDLPALKLPGRRGPRYPRPPCPPSPPWARVLPLTLFSQCLRGSVVKVLLVAAMPRAVLLNIRIFAGRDDSAPFAPPRAGAKKVKAES